MRTRFSKTMRALGVTAGVVLFATGFVTPAHAADKPGSGSVSGWSGHCVVMLAKGSSNATPQCFTTFTQAIAVATGGVVTDAPASPSASTNDSTTAKIVAANQAKRTGSVTTQTGPPAPYTYGTEYQDANYGGWTMTFAGPAACTGSFADTDYSVNLPAPIWDQISSFKTYNVCWANHYYLQNFGAPSTGYYPSQATMPPMNVGGGPYPGNDNTRSISWT